MVLKTTEEVLQSRFLIKIQSAAAHCRKSLHGASTKNNLQNLRPIKADVLFCRDSKCSYKWRSARFSVTSEILVEVCFSRINMLRMSFRLIMVYQ